MKISIIFIVGKSFGIFFSMIVLVAKSNKYSRRDWIDLRRKRLIFSEYLHINLRFLPNQGEPIFRFIQGLDLW